MEFMLETICDIKNNKRKPNEENAQHTRINKWLQKVFFVKFYFLDSLKVVYDFQDALKRGINCTNDKT